MTKNPKLLLFLAFLLIVAGIGLIFKNSLPFFTDTGENRIAGIPEAKAVDQNKGTNEAHKVNEQVTLYKRYPNTGEIFGELTIPKINATLPIIEGTNEDELEKGVGHYSQSVLPGEKDNSVLSGHRDTVFRRLGKVGKGDLLIVKTIAGEFTYKVKRTRIVDADDRTVIIPKPRATLTVTTCYPFNYIGDAPQRYILVADLVK